MDRSSSTSSRILFTSRIVIFSSRAFPGLLLMLIFCSAAFSQQITCPVTTATTNTSSTAFNALNPCQIQTGVGLTNDTTGSLENMSGATLLNSGTFTNNGALLNDSGATLTNDSGALLENFGTLTNNGALNNDG